MLYYVKTGDVDTSLYAESHKQAALKTIINNNNYGFCVVVSEEEIDQDFSKHIYFSTERLLEECGPRMRLVY